MINFGDLKFLADENTSLSLIKKIRDFGLDIVHTSEIGLNGKSDLLILEFATNDGRVVLTCDSDFSRIAVTNPSSDFGIVYLRPNHIDSIHHLETVRHILAQNLSYEKPFILVAERYDDIVRIRLRNNLK